MVPLKLSSNKFGVDAGVQINVEPRLGGSGVRVVKRSQEESVKAIIILHILNEVLNSEETLDRL